MWKVDLCDLPKAIGFPDSSVGKESTCNAGDPACFDSWVGKIRRGRDRLPTPVFLGFPCGSAGKESASNVGDLGSIPGLGRSPGEGKGYPLQYSCLENSRDSIVHGITKNLIQLSDFHTHTHCLITTEQLTHIQTCWLEKDVAPHSSILAWRIPWVEQPGGLPSMGSQELDVTATNTHTQTCY